MFDRGRITRPVYRTIPSAGNCIGLIEQFVAWIAVSPRANGGVTDKAPDGSGDGLHRKKR